MLIIGHHMLYGKVVTLEKPLIAMVKSSPLSDDRMTVDDGDSNRHDTHYIVKAVIRKKILFKTRPKPIIANVPKKV